MAKRNDKSVRAPWEQDEPVKMLVCHFADGELEGLDNLQGGPSIDPETGIREYSKLSQIIEIPQVRETFHHVFNELDQHGKVSPDLEKIYKSTKKHSLPYRESPTEEHNPAVRELEKKGINGDTKLALIPVNLAEFLIELRHIPAINPKTGLLMFGGIKYSIGRMLGKSKGGAKKFENTIDRGIRLAGSIAGAYFGGPLGAGIGRGIAGMATGQKPGDAFRSGLTHMGRAAMISGAGGALSSLAPGMAGSIGSAASSYLPASMVNAGSNFFTGPLSTMGLASSAGNALGLGSTGATGLAGGAGSIPSISTSAVGVPGAIAGTSGAHSLGGVGAGLAGKAAAPGLLSKLMGFAPLAAAGLSYMGSKRQQKHEEKQQEEQNAMIERHREEQGFNKQWVPVKPKAHRLNPKYHDMTSEDMKYGNFREPRFLPDEEPQGYKKGGLVQSFSKGTLVRGPGKGQADEIRTSVPEGSYIIDASSTSMFGDGSSGAGASALKEFENIVKKKFSKHLPVHVEKKIKAKTQQIPVFLSDSEYKFDPVTVTMLGKGSNDKGAALLKQMVLKVRKHKISNGDGLPPKAKDPFAYISQGRR